MLDEAKIAQKRGHLNISQATKPQIASTKCQGMSSYWETVGVRSEYRIRRQVQPDPITRQRQRT